MSHEAIEPVRSSSGVHSTPLMPMQELNLKDYVCMARNEGEGYVQACQNGGKYEGQTADVWYSLTMGIMNGLKERIHELPQNMQSQATNALDDFQKAMKNYLDSQGSSYYESTVDKTYSALQQAFGVS